MTRKEINTWLRKDGIDFLKALGVREGHVVVDFGCNEGHYTIPAARIVNNEGKVYALDKTSRVLKHVAGLAKDASLSNITFINTEGRVKIEVPDNCADFMLFYDILHYFSEIERKEAYQEARRILKEDGMLSIFPKHNKEDWPMMSLRDRTVNDVVAEVEDCGFTLKSRTQTRLFHDEGFDTGTILNFTR